MEIIRYIAEDDITRFENREINLCQLMECSTAEKDSDWDKQIKITIEEE